ncbi:MAG: IMP dehydrogenase [Verrucomicrobiae bacterium]|nr:IMP dehydrogenase [Verrucomicrobiae bacterium]
MGDLPLGLSFDDVLLVPRKSAILPSDAVLSTRLTDGIPLNIPIVSSAMDTVTEAELAIALAREGGMGVIHRNMPVPDQAEMVAKVKRSENMVIQDPFTVTPQTTLETLQQIMMEKGVNGFPVVDMEGNLCGMVTTRDIWMIENHSGLVSDVMTPRDRLVTAPVDTALDDARRMLYQNRIEKLPLVDANGKLAGLITSQDIEKRERYTNAAKDPNGRLRVGAAIGVGEDCFERAEAVIQAGADAVFIDAATGHTTRVMQVIEHLRSLGSVPVVAGNVVTEEGATDLCDAGASAVKVGVGPGSICTTRVISGVGTPQFTAIQEVAKVCRERGVPVIADGGIRYSGDVVKALAAGADLVMLGSLLAGCRESPGAMVNYQGRTWKEYRGMGSLKAMRKGSGDRYGQNSSGKLVAEGVEARVPYRGLLSDTVFQLLGGLRSGMGYVGAADLGELREKARFVRITAGGLKESHPHDITITEEPVNYQSGA